ncbi:helix-turn-helix domain-containing protein [Roseibium aggregatum]|uniref:helix-turn-helix domain-containing protein n=1 Tax=Roseibium aggregatum TaxID=187304 RepID=UPI0025AD7DF1|nr:helix-turn-helix transcriptional regulator [Roseibium aggregatum]WJS05716.1 helix-turn-helix transcriptional regulator [Roseibium aggregatum]
MPQTLKSIIRVLDLDEQIVLRNAGLPADYLSDETRQVNAIELCALDRAIEQVSGRNDISHTLAMFRARTPRPSSTMAFAGCDTLLSGYERLAELKGPYDGTVLSVCIIDDRFRVEIRPLSPEFVLLHWVLLCEILYFVELGRTYTGRQIQPLEVGIIAADKVRTDDVAYLGVTPVESKRAFVEFTLTDGNRPLLTTRKQSSSDHTCQREGRTQPRHRMLMSERVESVLLESMLTGNCNIATVSEHLNLSARKLQRLLKAEGTSFRAILDEQRRLLATRYLEIEQRPVAEVAELLGYQNQNSFYRAFKSWTGTTTKTLRQVTEPSSKYTQARSMR